VIKGRPVPADQGCGNGYDGVEGAEEEEWMATMLM
jgi:hypothetical protein